MDMDQIARDIREGSFPKKSDKTLREDVTFGIVVDTLKRGAPGIGDGIREGIARSIAMKIEAANPPETKEQIPASEAWAIILKWLDSYTEEESTFSRYRDDVLLDGIMTASQRRTLAALFPKASRHSR